jgi:hypothetical protein
MLIKSGCGYFSNGRAGDVLWKNRGFHLFGQNQAFEKRADRKLLSGEVAGCNLYMVF